MNNKTRTNKRQVKRHVKPVEAAINKHAQLVAVSDHAPFELQRQYDRMTAKRKEPVLGSSMGFATSGLGGLLPNSLRVKLKYVDRFTPTPASGANFTQVYRGTSLFDPDFTGTGHQPYGYDELSAFYGAVHVSASTIRIFAIDNSSSSAPAQWECALVPTAVSSDFTASDPETVAEAPYGQAKIMSVHTGNPADNFLAKHMSVSQLFGLHPLTVGPGAVDWEAVVTANPANGFYWVISGQVIDEATTMANVVVYVEIVYHATFLFRKALSPS